MKSSDRSHTLQFGHVFNFIISFQWNFTQPASYVWRCLSLLLVYINVTCFYQVVCYTILFFSTQNTLGVGFVCVLPFASTIYGNEIYSQLICWYFRVSAHSIINETFWLKESVMVNLILHLIQRISEMSEQKIDQLKHL